MLQNRIIFRRYWVRLSVMAIVVVIVAVAPVAIFIQMAERGIIAGVSIDDAEDDEADSIDHMSSRVAVFMALNGIVAVTMGILVSRQISRPLQRLVDGVQRISTGELGHQVALKNPGYELGELGDAINGMSAALHQAEMLRQNMMADVSHELRTPLTVLEGHLRAALDEVYALDKAEVAKLYQQVQHLIRLVNDLHLLAKAEAHRLPLDMQAVDVEAVAAEVIANFALFAEERQVALSLAAVSSLPLLHVDEGRLRQILTNLVDNALRYTTGGQAIVIQLENTATQFSIVVRLGHGTAIHIDFPQQ